MISRPDGDKQFVASSLPSSAMGFRQWSTPVLKRCRQGTIGQASS